MGNVEVLDIHLAPGQFKDQVEVVPEHRALGIAHLGPGQATDFLFHLGLEVLRNGRLLEQLKIAFLLFLGAFVLTELILDDFHLLAQVVFLLVAFNRLAHFFADFALQLGNRLFTGQDVQQEVNPGLDFGQFQDLLLLEDRQIQMGCNGVGGQRWAGDRADQANHLRGNPRTADCILFKTPDQLATIGFRGKILFSFRLSMDHAFNNIVRIIADDIQPLGPVQAFNHHFDSLIGIGFENLFDAGQAANLVDVVWRRQVGTEVDLGRDKDQLVRIDCSLDCSPGFWTRHIKSQGHAGEND